eukprot:jgi/Psemu1/21851/gm1.21851_g
MQTQSAHNVPNTAHGDPSTGPTSTDYQYNNPIGANFATWVTKQDPTQLPAGLPCTNCHARIQQGNRLGELYPEAKRLGRLYNWDIHLAIFKCLGCQLLSSQEPHGIPIKSKSPSSKGPTAHPTKVLNASPKSMPTCCSSCQLDLQDPQATTHNISHVIQKGSSMTAHKGSPGQLQVWAGLPSQDKPLIQALHGTGINHKAGVLFSTQTEELALAGIRLTNPMGWCLYACTETTIPPQKTPYTTPSTLAALPPESSSYAFRADLVLVQEMIFVFNTIWTHSSKLYKILSLTYKSLPLDTRMVQLTLMAAPSNLAQLWTPLGQWAEDARLGVKSIPITITTHTLDFTYSLRLTSERQAADNMICLAFFSCLQLGEYNRTTTDNQAFALQDLTFFNGDNNGTAITHACSGDLLCCPVKAVFWQFLCHRRAHMQTNQRYNGTVKLICYYNGHWVNNVPGCTGAFYRHFPKGYLARSLLTGGTTMALLQGNYNTNIIQSLA